jgi:hypothetical protein
MVWHHRRGSVRAYWRQQRGYGKAESLLEAKWPEKYNAAGHVSWAGRVYGSSLAHVLRRRSLIYQGVWGRGLFQSVYQPRAGLLDSLPSMPEWYLLLGLLALLGSLGAFWPPLLLSWLVLGLACALSVGQAVVAAIQAEKARPARPLSQRRRFGFLSVVGLLFLIQPLARLCGRLEHGLSPWRLRGTRPLAWPRPRTMLAWYERWRPCEERLGALERAIRDQGVAVRRGGEFDFWDLEVRGSLLGGVRVLCAIEEHGGGKQLLRVRAWPRYSPFGATLVLGSAGLALSAALQDAWLASAGLAVLAGVTVWRMLRESAIGTVIRATERLSAE